MKIITKEFEVYEFSELSEEAQGKAINDYIEAMLEAIPYEEHPWKDAIDKAEQMLTPWFTGSYAWDYHKDEILEDLQADSYLVDGELFR